MIECTKTDTCKHFVFGCEPSWFLHKGDNCSEYESIKDEIKEEVSKVTEFIY